MCMFVFWKGEFCLLKMHMHALQFTKLNGIWLFQIIHTPFVFWFKAIVIALVTFSYFRLKCLCQNIWLNCPFKAVAYQCIDLVSHIENNHFWLNSSIKIITTFCYRFYVVDDSYKNLWVNSSSIMSVRNLFSFPGGSLLERCLAQWGCTEGDSCAHEVERFCSRILDLGILQPFSDCLRDPHTGSDVTDKPTFNVWLINSFIWFIFLRDIIFFFHIVPNFIKESYRFIIMCAHAVLFKCYVTVISINTLIIFLTSAFVEKWIVPLRLWIVTLVTNILRHTLAYKLLLDDWLLTCFIQYNFKWCWSTLVEVPLK